jgi:hypothetical protein
MSLDQQRAPLESFDPNLEEDIAFRRCAENFVIGLGVAVAAAKEAGLVHVPPQGSDHSSHVLVATYSGNLARINITEQDGKEYYSLVPKLPIRIITNVHKVVAETIYVPKNKGDLMVHTVESTALGVDHHNLPVSTIGKARVAEGFASNLEPISKDRFQEIYDAYMDENRAAKKASVGRKIAGWFKNHK